MKSIVDVSSVIYGGHNGNDRRLKGFPVGGIRKLFGIINQSLSSSDIALCFDGGATLKKELLPTYKAGRVPDYSVMAQIDLVKEMLTKCDIPFYWEEGYEADDFVYSICDQLLLTGSQDTIRIYSDDRDLSCCVTENISIVNVTSNGVCINRESYEDRVVKGKRIPYNTILLWKVLHGDSSDNYTALRIPGVEFGSLSSSLVSQVEPLISPEGFTELAYANYDVFKVLVDQQRDAIGEANAEALLKQGRIAFPYSLPVMDCSMEDYWQDYQGGDPPYMVERRHFKFFGNGNFNRGKFDYYCNILGLNKLRGSYVDFDSPEAREFLDVLALRSKELSDGTLAVKYNRRKREQVVAGAIQNMTLPG